MVHRTMQGKVVDMDKLARQHELTPAVGNMKVNARGDELGKGGQIVRKREEVVAEYYDAKKPVRKHAVPEEPTAVAVQPQQKPKKPTAGE